MDLRYMILNILTAISTNKS